jgi:hypothetical protein
LLDPLKLTNVTVWLVKLLHVTQFTTNLGEYIYRIEFTPVAYSHTARRKEKIDSWYPEMLNVMDALDNANDKEERVQTSRAHLTTTIPNTRPQKPKSSQMTRTNITWKTNLNAQKAGKLTNYTSDFSSLLPD